MAHKIDTVVLDKTGAVTAGKPLLMDSSWIPYDFFSSIPVTCNVGISVDPLYERLRRT
ncbi:MAG: hypothetical protein ABSC05_40335 [Candidatus Solibacter sp.]|jgi:hypothetical protein